MSWSAHPLVAVAAGTLLSAVVSALAWLMRRVLTGIDQLQAQITALDRQLVTHMAVEETQAAWRSAELAGMRDRLGRVESQIEAIHRRLDEVIT